MSRKKNHSMAMRRIRLHPAERQNIRRIWAAQTIEGQIHALTGGDVPRAVEKVATLVWVILAAAQIEKLPEDHAEIRVLRATANVVHECVGVTALSETQRLSLSAGLEAVKRLVPQLKEESLFFATGDCKRLLGMRAVTLADFAYRKDEA